MIGCEDVRKSMPAKELLVSGFSLFVDDQFSVHSSPFSVGNRRLSALIGGSMLSVSSVPAVANDFLAVSLILAGQEVMGVRKCVFLLVSS